MPSHAKRQLTFWAVARKKGYTTSACPTNLAKRESPTEGPREEKAPTEKGQTPKTAIRGGALSLFGAQRGTFWSQEVRLPGEEMWAFYTVTARCSLHISRDSKGRENKLAKKTKKKKTNMRKQYSREGRARLKIGRFRKNWAAAPYGRLA